MGREKGEGRRVTTTLVLTCPSTHGRVYSACFICYRCVGVAAGRQACVSSTSSNYHIIKISRRVLSLRMLISSQR